jgi:HEPN domain-containing protein
MANETALRWFEYADADLDSANILKAAYRPHKEIICFLCQQAVEKYLKGFLCAQGIFPQKIHVLETLCASCSDFDSAFDAIAKDCAYLSPFAVQARYPHEMEITDYNVEMALRIAEKISRFTPLLALKTQLCTVPDAGG